MLNKNKNKKKIQIIITIAKALKEALSRSVKVVVTTRKLRMD